MCAFGVSGVTRCYVVHTREIQRRIHCVLLRVFSIASRPSSSSLFRRTFNVLLFFFTYKVSLFTLSFSMLFFFFLSPDYHYTLLGKNRTHTCVQFQEQLSPFALDNAKIPGSIIHPHMLLQLIRFDRRKISFLRVNLQRAIMRVCCYWRKKKELKLKSLYYLMCALPPEATIAKPLLLELLTAATSQL